VVLEEEPINSENAETFPPGMTTALSIRRQARLLDRSLVLDIGLILQTHLGLAELSRQSRLGGSPTSPAKTVSHRCGCQKGTAG
jgi:hypothetical protein